MAKSIPPTLNIDGIACELLDYIGWQASAGVYAAEVQTETGPRKAVRSKGGQWRFWTIADRIGRKED